MIKFSYNKEIEREIFEEFIKKSKPKEISDLAEKELNQCSYFSRRCFNSKSIKIYRR